MSSTYINPYWILAVFAIGWFSLKIYDTIKEVRLRKRMRENSDFYLRMLATTLNDIGIIRKQVLTKKDVERLKETLSKFPSIQEVKKIRMALNRYLTIMDRYYAQMMENPTEVRERFVIPLCLNFVYLFGMINEDIRIFSMKRRKHYEKKKLTERTYAPKLLRDIIDKIIGVKK